MLKLNINGEIIKRRQAGSIVIQMSDLNVVIDTANAIYESEMVQWCHPDFITIITQMTTDPLFSQQYYLKNTGQSGGTAGIDINVETAWGITTSSSNIRVAIIDDGVEAHEDMANRVLQGFTPLNSNGYGAPTAQNVPGVTIGHGEACAGIIAASHNTLGIAGIAQNVQIIPINIFYNWIYSPTYGQYVPLESVQNIADAIEFAWSPIDGNVDVISNSWGYGTQPQNADVIIQEINNALSLGRLRNGKRYGCVVVFAAGNSIPFANVFFPASVNGVLAVGAINRNGIVWNYSCIGNALDVVAPSGNIGSGDITTTDRMGANGYNAGNYTSVFGGTSAACPQVAGIAALILSARPDLAQAIVRQAIEATCYKLPSYTFSHNASHPNGTWNSEVGHGLVNAYAAINSVASNVMSGIDFVINNNSSYDLYDVGIEVIGKLGSNDYYTTFVQCDPSRIQSGESGGYPAYLGNDIAALVGTGISDIWVNIYARIWNGATVYIRAILNDEVSTMVAYGYVTFSHNGNWISDYLGNDYGLTNSAAGSSIPYSGKRMLTINVQNNW